MRKLKKSIDKTAFRCYIDSMKSKKSNLSVKTRMSIYLPPDVRLRLEIEAKRQRRSLNAQIIYYLEEKLGMERTGE